MDVTLRPLHDGDAEVLFAWERDPVAVRMAAFTRADPDDRAAFDAHLARIRADPGVRMRMVEVDAEAVGTVAAFDADGEREVTYWIARAHWGRGIATAALTALLAEQPVRPLAARVAEANVASRRVLERAGFVEVARERAFAPGVGAEVVELLLRLG
ncbi:GNAT family N-acetyltransferase [Agrococcus sp. SGAir0287]|uniref:GNAT family N-acetyltransferase n=1 Tax=Agrococcus sp. SGAir0287 TaxID=2070347 RepID=UPI0010CD502F|nr:GNAT family N-acetyltransferase [Agrococcus sp. SGAir0287]QCR18328.1 GNAT family N-acetyltransferase [Agrococcus sp. SGAir0287]